jgi:hypothetical protein
MTIVSSALFSILCGAAVPAQGALTETPVPSSAYAYRARDMGALRAGFAHPPRAVGPWVYWIIIDNVMSKEEITREVEELATAGIAGAELRFLTFNGWGGPRPEGMDAATLHRIGHRKVEFLSDEFVDLLEHACAEAKRSGLQLAINMGMGWPPGGPWITDRHRSRHLKWEERVVTGPAILEEKGLPADSMILVWRLRQEEEEKTVVPGSFQSLTGGIRDGQLRWDVPAGRWLVGFFRSTPGGNCDKGDGPEADPGSREAVLFHLNHLFSRLDPKLRKYYGTTLIDVASDSWEYGRRPDRYWSPAILDAFPKVAGYDLREKMHALLGYGPDSARVLEDLEKVERRLVHDSFFVTATQFLHERGLGHRPQVYGRGLDRDLLEVYAAADTPEIEQGVVLPEAPWSAHTTGRPVVSAESFTFLSQVAGPVKWPHGGEWETSPALLRWHANRFFAEGINRIQMHAFSYSPPGVPLPGWRIYAETHLNRNVPWWPYMPGVTAWMARNQWVLQAGIPMADVLVYPVRSNPADGPYGKMGDRQPVSAANAVDAANEFTLPEVNSAKPAPCTFSNLCLLEDVKTESEAGRILQWLEHGVTVICCASLPAQWSGLRSPATARMRDQFEAARSRGRIVDARIAGWRKALDDVRSVRWTPETAKLVFQHRRVKGGDIYLLVNEGEMFRGEVSFPHEGRAVEHWDADTGEICPAAQFREDGGRTRLTLSLDHFASTLVSFTAGPSAAHVVQADGGRFRYEPDHRLYGCFDQAGRYEIRLNDGSSRTIETRLPSLIAVDGPWTLSVDGLHAVSPQSPCDRKLDRLVSWRELPELKHYAGTASYITEFDLASEWLAADTGLLLELGQVYEMADVWLNGCNVGVSWYPPFALDITGHARAGKNVLRIDVPNVLKNHLGQDDGYSRPSGMLGPVSIRPYGRTVLGARSAPPPPAERK